MAALISSIAIVIYGLQSVSENHAILFAVLLGCLAGGLFLKDKRVITLCTCLMLVHILSRQTALGQMWPAPVVISSFVGLLLLSLLEKKFWLKIPMIRQKLALSTGVIGIASVVGVYLWVDWNNITADQIVFKIDEGLSPSKVGIFILVFSVLNSFSEEFLFRGPLLDIDDKPGYLLVFAQAVAFGLYHFKGFPFGPSGSLLAFGFAGLQGYLRVKSRSFFYVWMSHLIVNLGMGLILLRI